MSARFAPKPPAVKKGQLWLDKDARHHEQGQRHVRIEKLTRNPAGERVAHVRTLLDGQDGARATVIRLDRLVKKFELTAQPKL